MRTLGSSTPPSPSESETAEPALHHRILFLQNCSVFEGFGGVEHYQDDFLTLAAEALGGENVFSVIPQRTERFSLEPRPYQTHVVRFSSKRWRQKIENRFSRHYFQEAMGIAAKLKPTLILNSHVALGPVAYLLHRKLDLPYLTLAYGIECWGDLWFQDEWCLQRAQGLISISHWTKQVLVDRGYDPSQIKIVQPILPSAYEKNPFPTKDIDVEKPFTLLTVSRLDAREQYKGQDHVLEALFRLRQVNPELRFHYIIQGDGTDRPRLEALVESQGLSDIVEFRSNVGDRRDLESAYREADVFVMPSRFGKWDGRWRGEGFGIVYLEAAAFGVPSIAYDCGGAKDIIHHCENGWLVNPDDIGELSRTLQNCATNLQDVRKMGKNAYESVMRDFTRPAILTQLKRTLSYF